MGVTTEECMQTGALTIERGTPADAAELIDYLKTISGETDNLSFGADDFPFTVEMEADYLAKQVGSTGNALFVARYEGRIVGDASLSRGPRRMSHRGELGVSVLRDMWGRGIGTALAERVLAFARENGLEQVFLEVRSDNARAIRLYEKFGFRKLCTYPAYMKKEDGQPIDCDFMILPL